MSQFLINFLKNMVETSKTLDHSKALTFLPNLIKVCKLLHLNELEITLWSLHIDISKWDLQKFQLSQCLLFSAIIAKEQLCDDPVVLVSYRDKIFAGDPSMSKTYSEWRSEYPIRPTFSSAQLNLQFTALRNVLLCDILYLF